MSFTSLKLIEPLLKALAEQGYKTPSPIQEKVIPHILNGRDVMAAAQTGTGKTAGFTLPMLQRLTKGKKPTANSVRALVLTPTRELAAQVGESVKNYGKHLPMRSAVVFGGVKINPQMMQLRRGVDVLVATPGRLLDLFGQNAFHFKSIEFLVLDEADRMLDMGFLPDIKKIISQLPQKRQTLLFSATFSSDIKQLGQKLLNEPVSVETSPANSTAKTVKQWMHPVDKKRKSKLLSFLIGHHRWQKVLVFVRTRRGANKLTYDLQKSGLEAAAIHGDKSQGARTRALAAFKNDEIRVLVATDIAARGLDIEQLPLVINFDLPTVAEDYIHRIGRTGRAGESGKAVSLVSADEVDNLSDIENLIRQLLPRKQIDGFEPSHTVPETYLKVVKKKKPHKKKLAKAKLLAAGKKTSASKPAKSRNNKPKASKNKVKTKDRTRSNSGTKSRSQIQNASKRKPASRESAASKKQ
ncbi:DEAD/DEAH box helicase [Aliikangiella coralliicola]|uniref:DEAD-box ATP-dependent RNA helicase RhpA n=1 Tax=Aliikangiella coralliicola TaxID=2592383 RepID=A0A545UCT6_9GAMM|nr:DEAD/DEAH box helicase [Aliikangiella coralliicola]TQV87279.1 DEAD/DEAH box helicase [Aliikangiella coralliicola]